MTRDDSLEILKEKLTEREFRKVATQGYSDVSLSVMAESPQKDARNMADTLFSVTSVNKLCDAYKSGVIDERDLNHIMEFARFQKNNEKYLGDMLDSITSHTMYHASAADTFVALAYEECTYVKAVEMIQNRVYTPTDQASLSVYPEVAIELDKLGVHLRGCEGFNYYYDVSDIKQSLDAGDAIFVKDYELAVKVREYMRLSDWEKFRDSAAEIISEYPDRDISGNELEDLRRKFVQSQYESKLSEKMQGEYDRFIEDVKSKSPDEIVDSAYQIVTKKDILDFCAYQSASLSEKQYKALLSSSNTLDEVYETWCTNSEFHALYDIGLALEETADDIQYSIDRKQEQEREQQKAPQMQAKEAPAPEIQQKPKHKAR
ncbi:MAG: DUF3848 domain-containing protein [Ruminiclostridium sp.]|nr:DUF3848 domain-containing protein [Ruminiclostridium sp.]